MDWSYLPLVTHQLQTKLKLSNNRLFMTPPKTDEVEEMVKTIMSEYLWHDKNKLEMVVRQALTSLHQAEEERMKAFAHAIMTAAHENQEDDGTQYPKVSTHTLAREIKKLIPDFNYHGYIKRWSKEEMRGMVDDLKERGASYFGICDTYEKDCVACEFGNIVKAITQRYVGDDKNKGV